VLTSQRTLASQEAQAQMPLKASAPEVTPLPGGGLVRLTSTVDTTGKNDHLKWVVFVKGPTGQFVNHHGNEADARRDVARWVGARS
jgi:hypothetical protein